MQNSTTFNLSILECKSPNSLAVRGDTQLLISPYWNVNATAAIGAVGGAAAFNLSILECK